MRLVKGGTSLSKIANLAASGLTSMSVSTTVENLIASENTPTIPDAKVSEIAHRAPVLQKFIHGTHIPAMVALDVSCNIVRGGTLSRDILKIAQSKTQGVMLADQSVRFMKPVNEKGVQLSGYLPLLFKMCQLVQQKQEVSEPEGGRTSHSVIAGEYYNHTLVHYLNTATIPLSSQNLENLVRILVDESKWVRKLHKAWNDMIGIKSPYMKSLEGRSPFTKHPPPNLRLIYGQFLDHIHQILPQFGIIQFLLGYYIIFH